MPRYDFIQMDALTDPVVRFVNIKGKVWDNVAEDMVATGTYADTAIALARNTFINGIPVLFPEKLPAGDYHMMFYDAAAPANTDAYTRWYRIGWNDVQREICYCKDMGPMA
jgi:hypothetical protein